MTRGGDGIRNSNHSIGQPPQRLVYGIEGFEHRATLVIPPLVKPASHRPLQAVDLGFQSGVPGDLPIPPQPVLQVYFILNAGWYRKPWVVARATLGNICRQNLHNSAGKVLNSRVDCHPVVQFRIERNFIFQVSLEVGPVSAPLVVPPLVNPASKVSRKDFYRSAGQYNLDGSSLKVGQARNGH